MKRPAWPFTLNTNSDQARDLLFWAPFPPYRGLTTRDLARGASGVLSGGLDWAIDKGSNASAGTDTDEEPAFGIVPNWTGTASEKLNFAGVHFLSPITISIWINFNTMTLGNSQLILGEWDNSGNTWLLYWWGAGAGRISLNAGGDNYFNLAPNAGRWYNIVFDSANAQGYINGFAQSMTGSAQTWSSTSNDFQIGKWSSGQLDARIGDVRIYNGSLSSARIAALFNAHTRWELYKPLARRAALPFILSPSTASITITTYAPLITTPVSPSTATLRITTYAPTVNISAPTPVITGSLVKVDWNDDGDFSDTGEDVTGRLISTQPMSTVRGKDQLRLLSPPMAGAFNCEIDNRSRDYSVENAGSPLFSNLHPGHKVRATLTTAGTNFTIFTGVLDGIPQHPEFGKWSVEFPSLGSLSKLRGKKVSTELLENVKTGAAINAVLDAADWPADERLIDDGQTTFAQFWANDQDALDLVVSLMITDGPGASIYENPDGWFIFEDRHYRLVADRCTTSQFTFTDQDYISSENYEYDPGLRDIINACDVQVTTRSLKEQQVIWRFEKPLVLGADEVRKITAEFSDPCKEIQTPDPNGGTNEVQRLAVLGTSPLIRLSFGEEQTADCNLSTTPTGAAGVIDAALEALPSIGAGNVVVGVAAVGVDMLAFTITFTGDLAHRPIEALGTSAVGQTGKPVEAKITHATPGQVDDYTLLAGSVVSIALNRTSGQSVEITVTAGASGAYIDGLQLRGRPLSVDSNKRISNSLDASVSQGKYGVRSYSPASIAEISEEEALQLADNIVRYYQDPRPTLVFGLKGIDGTVQLQQLAREISDRISVVEAQTGITADFFVERIEQRVTEGPRLYTQFGCEKVGNFSVSGGGGSLWDTAVWDSALYGS